MNMLIRAIIIDDEEPARDIIRNYLKDQDKIEIIAECSDGFAGVKAINELKPDIVFLDIQMPKLTGFEMLELIDEIPLIIFITAHPRRRSRRIIPLTDQSMFGRIIITPFIT